jgi:hypothetical protein
MAAFQTGFQLGSRIATDALDRKERAERQKKEDEERELRKDLTRLQIGSATEEARRKAEVAQLTRGLSDTIQGIDRPATNAALDADFNAALQAPDNAVMAKNAARQGVRPAAAPALSGVPADAAAAAAAPAGPAAGVMPAVPAVPTVRDGSNAANEQALTVRGAVDPLSPEYRQRVSGQMAAIAAATGDIERLRSLETERRTTAEDALIAQRTKEYKATEDQIGATTVFVNQTSRRITMSTPDKNGLVGLSVVTPDGNARFETLSRGEQAKLYAAVGLLDVNPTRALKMMEEVNKDLAQAIRDENLTTSQVATNTNTVAQTGANIDNIRADNKRADDAARRLAGADAQTRKDAEAKANAAAALYKQNNPNATPADVEAVRRGVISAVPTIDANSPAQVKLAQALINAKVAPDMATGLRMAMQGVQKSRNDFYQDIYGKALTASMGSAEQAKKVADQALKDYDAVVGAAQAPAPGAPAPAAPAQPGAPLTFNTAAEAEAAGAAGKIPPGSKFNIKNGPGGRPVEGVQWLPAPAPSPVPAPRPAAAVSVAPRPAAPVVPAPAAQPRSPQEIADEFANIGAVPR